MSVFDSIHDRREPAGFLASTDLAISMLLKVIAIALLALFGGSAIGLVLMRTRRVQRALYHIHYPVFSVPPRRVIIDSRGRLRRFYLRHRSTGFLIGTDLLKISETAAVTRQVSYHQSRCETVFAQHEDAEKLLNEAILLTLNEGNDAPALAERYLTSSEGIHYSLTLWPLIPDGVQSRPHPAWPGELAPTSLSGQAGHMEAETSIQQGYQQHKKLEKDLKLFLKGEKLERPLDSGQECAQGFILRLTQDSVVDGVPQTLQVQFAHVFEDVDVGTRCLEKAFSALCQRDPAFSSSFYRAIRTPNGQIQRFFVHSQAWAFQVAIEHELEDSPSHKTVKQTLLAERHPQRAIAEAEAIKRFESYRCSAPLFAEPPVRMMLAPNRRHYRGHIGEVLEGYKVGIEFDTFSGPDPNQNPLTHQEVLNQVWPTLEAAHAALAEAFDHAKTNYPAFSSPPLRSIYLLDGSMYQLYICPLPEKGVESHSGSKHSSPSSVTGSPGAWNRSYLHSLQRALLSQFEAYRQEHQSAQPEGLAQANAYDARFSLGIERSTSEAELFLTVQTEMPDYSFSWLAQADLEGMIKRLLHQSPLFSGSPLKSITTAEGLTRHFHVGVVNEAFLIGIESHQTQGLTTIIRQVELADVHLERASAEQHLDNLFHACRLAQGIFRTNPVREVTGSDNIHYRFFIAPGEGGFRIGIESQSSPTVLKQSVSDKIFPDDNTAEIEAYRVRAKN